MEKSTLLLIANGSEEIETVTIFDILMRAEIQVTLASIHDHLAIKGSHGLEIIAQNLLVNVQDNYFDAIILPGGLPGAEYFSESNLVLNLLARFYQENLLVGAICASPAYVLQRNRLFINAKMTGFPATKNEFPAENWIDKSVCFDEKHNLITAQGPNSAIEFSLEIVKQLEGREKANNISAGLLAPFVF